MVLIKEYRIPLPFTLEEYERGLLYTIAKASEGESNDDIPMQLIQNREFENEEGFKKGIFTHRIISISNRLPEWGKKLLIRSGTVLQVEEKSWNAFPDIKTIYTCSLFSEDKFEIIVESKHVEDAGTTVNIHNIPKSLLGQRKVDIIDIAVDELTDQTRSYRKEEDPTLFESKKLKRGPLLPDWKKRTKPIMCAYKLVTVNFNYWGLRSKVEKLLQDVIRNVYLTTHRQVFCWIDEWHPLSYKQIRIIEAQAKKSIPESSTKSQEIPQKHWWQRSKL